MDTTDKGQPFQNTAEGHRIAKPESETIFMRVKLIPGPKNEKLIALLRETVDRCQHEEGSSTYYDAHQGCWSPYPHQLGSCSGCDRWNKFDCDIMKLCYKYGYDKIYDAAYHAFNGDKETLHNIEDFLWEDMTEESYSQFLRWLSKDKIMELSF